MERLQKFEVFYPKEEVEALYPKLVVFLPTLANEFCQDECAVNQCVWCSTPENKAMLNTLIDNVANYIHSHGGVLDFVVPVLILQLGTSSKR